MTVRLAFEFFLLLAFHLHHGLVVAFGADAVDDGTIESSALHSSGFRRLQFFVTACHARALQRGRLFVDLLFHDFIGNALETGLVGATCRRGRGDRGGYPEHSFRDVVCLLLERVVGLTHVELRLWGRGLPKGRLLALGALAKNASRIERGELHADIAVLIAIVGASVAGALQGYGFTRFDFGFLVGLRLDDPLDSSAGSGRRGIHGVAFGERRIKVLGRSGGYRGAEPALAP